MFIVRVIKGGVYIIYTNPQLDIIYIVRQMRVLVYDGLKAYKGLRYKSVLQKNKIILPVFLSTLFGEGKSLFVIWRI